MCKRVCEIVCMGRGVQVWFCSIFFVCVFICVAFACVRWLECAHGFLCFGVLALACMLMYPHVNVYGRSVHDCVLLRLRIKLASIISGLCPTGLCRRSWAIRESSARGARAKILVYLSIYIFKGLTPVRLPQ